MKDFTFMNCEDISWLFHLYLLYCNTDRKQTDLALSKNKAVILSIEMF